MIFLKKVGFIAKVKSRGNLYYYLRVSFRNNQKPRNKNLFAFGNQNKAINSIEGWISRPESFPGELKELGYDLEDAARWLQEIKG
jgi:hypothetical protein